MSSDQTFSSDDDQEPFRDEALIKKRRKESAKKYRGNKKNEKYQKVFELKNSINTASSPVIPIPIQVLEEENNDLIEEQLSESSESTTTSDSESFIDDIFDNNQNFDDENSDDDSSYCEAESEALLYPNSNVSIKSFEFQLLAFSIKHHLNDDCVIDLLAFFAKLLPEPNKCPKSLNKIKNNICCNKNVMYYSICITCNETLQENKAICSKCANNTLVYNTFDVFSQINSIMLRNENYKKVIQSSIHLKNKVNNKILCQPQNGSIYQSCMNYNQNKLIISLSLNSDGAPLVTGQNVSMWPVVAKIIELPDKIAESFENLIFIGIWLNKEKPLYEKFLSSCIDRILNTIDRFSKVEIGGLAVILRCQSFIADLPACAAFLNVKQFNGYDSCINCFHPGQYSSIYSKMTYKPIPGIEIPAKTNAIHEYLSEKAETINAACYGVKGPTSLSKLIKIPDQVPYDYMHLVLQGHCKWFLKHLFKTKTSPIIMNDETCSLLNEKLRSIKLPHSINRKPRDVYHFSKWKATEIKIFSFYIAIPLLLEKIPSIYFCHYACYIFAIRLIHEPVSETNLRVAQEILYEYYNHLGIYYGDYAYDFTSHALIHLVDQVKKHGPLKSHSQFVFEGALGNLKRLIHGTKGFLNQVTNRLLIISELYDKRYLGVNFLNKTNDANIYVLKPFSKRPLNEFEKTHFALARFTVSTSNSIVLTAQRISIRDIIFHSKNYNRKFSSNSYTVCFIKEDKQAYGEILEIFEFENLKFAVISVFKVLDIKEKLPQPSSSFFYKTFSKLLDQFYAFVDIENVTLDIVNVENIQNKCIVIPNQFSISQVFITKLVYDYEHD